MTVPELAQTGRRAQRKGPRELTHTGRAPKRKSSRELTQPTTEALVLTPEQARRYLGVSDRSLYRMLKRGIIAAERLGGQWFIPKQPFFERFGWPSSEKAESVDRTMGSPTIPLRLDGDMTRPGPSRMQNERTEEANALDGSTGEPAARVDSFPLLISPNAVERIYGVKAKLVRGLADDFHNDPNTGIRNIRRNGRIYLFWGSVVALFGPPRPKKTGDDGQ